MAKKEEMGLMKFDAGLYPVLEPEARAEIVEAIHANLGTGALRPLDLQRVTVPPGGGVFWTVYDLDNPEGTPVKELRGVVVHMKKGRTFWEQALGDGASGTPPDCFSEDMVNGTGNPGGPCAQCPHAQWGSDPNGGRAQRCKQRTMLFLLEPGKALPTVVMVPPASLSNLTKYMLALASNMVPFYRVETRLGLRKTGGGGAGVEYSEVVFNKGEALPTEAAEQVKQYAQAMRAVFDATSIEPQVNAG